MEQTKKSKIKKITGIIFNVLIWLFVIFAVIITIIAVSANTNKKNVPSVGGKCFLTVQSGSMDAKKPSWVAKSKPSGFKTGDLIIGKYIAGNDSEIKKLEIGDIITFEYDINGDGVTSKGEYDTHRIAEIVYKDSEKTTVDYYKTQGDNAEYSRRTDTSEGTFEQVYANKIIAKYTGTRIGGVGKAITKLSTPLGFGLCIVVPLILFFGYELVVFIKTVITVKNEGKKVISQADEELIKQRAIEEYLKRQEENKKIEESKESSESDKNNNGEIKAEDNDLTPKN